MRLCYFLLRLLLKPVVLVNKILMKPFEPLINWNLERKAAKKRKEKEKKKKERKEKLTRILTSVRKKKDCKEK